MSVKDKGSSPALMRGFLQRGFLNPSPASIPIVKEGAAASSSSIAIKGEDSFTQSQKWPEGFGPSREVVAPEQGDELWDEEDDDFPLPLGVFPPDWVVDWELKSDEGLDPPLAILDAFRVVLFLLYTFCVRGLCLFLLINYYELKIYILRVV